MFTEVVTSGQDNLLVHSETYKGHKLFIKKVEMINQEIIDGYIQVLKRDNNSDFFLDDVNEGYSCSLYPEISYIGSLAIDGQPQDGKYIGITSDDFRFVDDKQAYCLEECHRIVDDYLLGSKK